MIFYVSGNEFGLVKGFRRNEKKMKARIPKFLSVILAVGFITSSGSLAEDVCANMQNYDPDFIPHVTNPVFPGSVEKIPLVVIDAEHYNFHKIGGRYKPFAELLINDGYRVEGAKGKYSKFTKENLRNIDVLVMANVVNEVNFDTEEYELNAKLPTPSAFDDDEIQAVKEWIIDGGSLLLIADHMPFTGVAEKLADVFGFTLANGYNFPANFHYMIEFNTADGSLKDHPIVRGRPGKSEAVTSIMTFVGEASWMQPNSKAQPLMVLGEGTRTILPTDLKKLPTKPSEPTDLAIPNFSSVGMLQGATLKFGKGRVVMLGEGGMLSAQNAGKVKMGMNNPKAKQNKQFTLNILHWLSGLL